ncbi:protein unc-13 homolog 4B-like [Uranotaenia lowii]|uniref:protein unc-13 homolog 4B-like n=1 Tax=Uranotaenia lowii TaxID=190385 RepID=UPI00247AF05D|nr:protein unc-13 homolog 4B-like [Uranotaenia lowii]
MRSKMAQQINTNNNGGQHHSNNLSTFIDHKIEALQAKWNKTKPEMKNRTLEKEAFFEKFGTLLKQQSSQFLLQTKREVAPHDESSSDTQELFGAATTAATAVAIGHSQIKFSNKGTTINPPAGASVNANGMAHAAGTAAAGTKDATSDTEAFEDLYEKVLMEIINGNFGKQDISEKTLFTYAQEVFKVNEKTHDEILKRARFKPTSEVYLKVELIEAKLNERPNMSAAFNPFVVMYLQSGLPDRLRSSIREATTNPVWKECFSLPASDGSRENLILEIFHHDCKMTKVKKTIRMCQKHALSCVRPRSSFQKLIGRTSIPIESISSSGLVMWYTLNKKKRTEPQGTVKLKFHFSSAQNKANALREHEALTKMFLEYELNSSSVARYWWAGKFTTAGDAILKQHAICADLTECEKVLTYWNVYTTVHVTYPIAFGLFENLLEKVCSFIKTGSLSTEGEDIKRFWAGARSLLPSCYAVIIKLRKRIAGDKDIVKTVISVLHILAKVDSIRTSCDGPLFQPEKYEHFKHKLEQNPEISIRDVTLMAVRTGAKTWFDQAVTSSTKANFSDEEKLQNFIQLIQLLQSDITRAKTYYDGSFKSITDIEYTREVCKQHECSIVCHIKPSVEKICKTFKKLTIRLDQHNRVGEMDALDMSSSLFELYIVVKLFIAETDKELKQAHNADIVNFHVWFVGGISYWCDVFALKALARLSQAIDVDELQPELGIAPRQSSSAAEFLNIVRQIKTFWEQLAWPDPQELNRFLKRSIGDICSCCIYYADRISLKLKQQPADSKKQPDMSTALELIRKCILVNSNLSILIDTLIGLPKALGYSLLDANANESPDQMLPISGLSSWKTKTLKLMIDHCMSIIKSSMVDSLGKFDQIKDNVNNFATQTSTLIQKDISGEDQQFVMCELWKHLTLEFSNMIKMCIEKKTSIASFANLKDFYIIIAQAYLPELKDGQEDLLFADKLHNIEKNLTLHSSSTRDLIHQYYLACLEAQNRIDEPERGVLSVRCYYRNDALEIQVIAAENIKLPLDFKGSCDSYVKINLVPGYRFSNVQMPKTRTKSKNHSPTYNEKFTLKISQEQRDIPDALLVFNVKVSELLGISQRHVGECFLRLDDIPVSGSDRDLQSVDVQHLFLGLPENIESDCIPVLEYRQNDKEAVQFFKKLKQKLGKAAYTGSVISIF